MIPTMATAINPFTPVTPPPENQTFAQKPVPLQPTPQPPPPPALTSFNMSLPTPTGFAAKPDSQPLHQQQQQQPGQTQTQAQSRAYAQSAMPPPPSRLPPLPPFPQTFQRTARSQQPQAQPQPPQSQVPAATQAPPLATLTMDPRDLATVTRIAAFYQQRCQAVTNYQQQRCRAWAASYGQKCHETMRAAMMVVAWYVRDRVRRRRRKKKDRFRRGLRECCGRAKTGGAGPGAGTGAGVSKGERVRRWVMQVPESVLPADAAGPVDRAADKEKPGFTPDEETPPDRDTKLFQMADGLIRSQYRGVEVPFMGVLSFDESESESDDGAGSGRECRRCMARLSDVEVAGDPPDQYERSEAEKGLEDEGEEYEEYGEEDDLYEDDYMSDVEEEEEEAGSQLVEGGGTGKSSRENEGSLGLI